MDPEAVSGANHRCKSGVRKRTLEHAKTITQSVPASAEDHCAECRLVVPQKKAKRSNMIRDRTVQPKNGPTRSSNFNNLDHPDPVRAHSLS